MMTGFWMWFVHALDADDRLGVIDMWEHPFPALAWGGQEGFDSFSCGSDVEWTDLAESKDNELMQIC